MWYKAGSVDLSAKARRRRQVGYRRKYLGVIRHADLSVVKDQRVSSGKVPRRGDFNLGVSTTVLVGNRCHFTSQGGSRKQANAYASATLENEPLILGTGRIHPRPDGLRVGGAMGRLSWRDICIASDVDATFEYHGANRPNSSPDTGNRNVLLTAFCNKLTASGMRLRNPERVLWMPRVDGRYGPRCDSRMLQCPCLEYAACGSKHSRHTVTAANYRDCAIRGDPELWSLAVRASAGRQLSVVHAWKSIVMPQACARRKFE